MNVQSLLLFLAHWWWILAIVLYGVLNAVMRNVLTARGMCLAYAALVVSMLWWFKSPMWAWLVAAVWFAIYGIELVLADFLSELKEMQRQQLAVMQSIGMRNRQERADSV